MDPIIVRGTGGRQASVAVATSTKLVFTGGTGFRDGVYVTAYTADVYIRAANLTESDPSVSSANYDIHILAGSTLLIPWASSIAIWAQSNNNVSAVEVL